MTTQQRFACNNRQPDAAPILGHQRPSKRVSDPRWPVLGPALALALAAALAFSAPAHAQPDFGPPPSHTPSKKSPPKPKAAPKPTPAPDQRAPAPDSPDADPWTIVLATFSGEGHERQAAAVAAEIAARTRLPDVRVQPRGRGSAVVTGRYPGPDDQRAQRDLAAARAASLAGQTPFAGAFLAPPAAGSDLGDAPRYHLSRAREEFGSARRYTLQIAVYESPDRDEARKAAEQAAALLRRDGEPAFYYHGPQRSMVTVGAFTDADAGVADGRQTGSLSPELAGWQRRHPYNLLNGNRTILVGPGKKPQPSFLVEIPRDTPAAAPADARERPKPPHSP